MTIYLRLPDILANILKIGLYHMIDSQKAANRYKADSKPLSALIKPAVALCLVVSSSQLVSIAQNSNTILKGNVKEQNYLSPGKGPSLGIGDLKGNEDSFGKGGPSNLPNVGETFEPPPDAFDLNGDKASSKGTNDPGSQIASGTGPFGQELNPGFKGEFSSGVPGLSDSASTDSSPFNLSAEDQGPLSGVETEIADPDNTPDMQLAWDQWHKQVAEAIYQKFNSLAQLAFQYSHPLACYVTYTVTRDGRIINVQLQQKSANVAFNAMVMMVVNSMSGQSDVLTFPTGSRRTTVNKAGMFTQNYGVQGFKYTTGDKEMIPGHQ